jgi:hypothetical protein
MNNSPVKIILPISIVINLILVVYLFSQGNTNYHNSKLYEISIANNESIIDNNEKIIDFQNELIYIQQDRIEGLYLLLVKNSLSNARLIAIRK